MENKMTVTEFFDVHNLEHLKAYKEVMDTGVWPIDFWVKIKDLEIETGWYHIITSKLARAYIELMLKDNQNERE